MGGTYYWNYATISGNGIFGMNNTNMVMWMTNDLPVYGFFTGPVTVSLGRLHLVGNENYDPTVMSTITVGDNTNAILEVHDTSPAPPIISGSLTLNGPNSRVQFDYDNSGNVFQVASNLTAANATITVNVVGSPLGKNANGYNLMTYNGTLASSFSPVPVITGAGLSSAGYYAYITTGGGNVKLVVVDAYIWTNPGNGNWSAAGNWSLQPVAAGQVATFGSSAPGSYTTVNLDASYTIGGVVFNNTNSFAITTSGQTMTLGNSGNGTSISALAGTSNLIGAPIVLGENTSVGVLSGGMNLTLSGVLSGTGALVKSGDGTAILSSANTYSGGTTINAGTVKIGTGSSLGSAATNTIAAGTLELNGQTLNATTTNVILMAGGGTLQNSNASPASVLQPVVQTGGTVGYVKGSGNLTVQQWSGPAAFNVTNYDTGTLDLAGTNDNAFLQLHSFAGTVLLDKAGASGVHAASLLDVEGGLVKIAGTNGDEIYDANTLTVNGGTFDMNGHNELVGSLAATSLSGIILNNAAGTTNTLTVVVVTGGGSSSYNGTIKDGAGKLAVVIGEPGTLGGTNLFTGGLTLSGGVLGGIVTFSNTFPTNLTITVANGSVLNLAFGVTNQIGALVLGGVSQPPGIYKTGMTGLITGTGALLIPSAAGPSSPATLTNSITGSTLTLKWPAGQSWRLVSQTNSLSTGLNPNNAAWTTVSGVGDGSATITINPANPTVYYKLVYP